MTALGADTVERTFSAVGRYLTGLPGPQTHEAGRQNLGDLVEAPSRGLAIRCYRHCGKLAEILELSSVNNGLACFVGFHRSPSQTKVMQSCAKAAPRRAEIVHQ